MPKNRTTTQQKMTEQLAARFIRSFQDRLVAGQLQLHIGETTIELNGQQAGPQAVIHIHRVFRLFYRLARQGPLGFSEAYMDGEWDSPDPTTLLQLLAINETATGKFKPAGFGTRFLARLYHRLNANSLQGSKQNIAHHYDLGNAFYRLWLDASMTYSCALFSDETSTLEQAQANKYRNLLAGLELTSEAKLLEIGCGWGGFARYAANQGHHVTGITLSREQLAWAKQQLSDKPYAEKIALSLCDYRQITGQYDDIVSIEMFEAVGENYWAEYMATLWRCLKPGGRAALQIITIDEADFEDYKAHPDFIQKYIFPGGMLPTVERFDQLVKTAGFTLVERQFYAEDYAKTLNCWQQRFIQQAAAIRLQGYDQKFMRMWHYYLFYCEVGFREQRINLMQVVLEKPD